MIESELVKYNDFYVSLIETFDGQEQLSLSSNNVNVASNKIRRLIKKIKYSSGNSKEEVIPNEIEGTSNEIEVKKKKGLFRR
jgi:hypothetical protein